MKLMESKFRIEKTKAVVKIWDALPEDILSDGHRHKELLKGIRQI